MSVQLPSTPIQYEEEVAPRPDFLALYGDPLLYLLATMSVGFALFAVTMPRTIQHVDFLVFWDALRWNASGHDLYTAPASWWTATPNLAPPALLIVLAPFTALPFPTARAAWMIVSLSLYALCVFWVCKAVDRPFGRTFSIFLLSHAVFLSIYYGNVSAPLTVCLTRAWLDQRERKDIASGIWLGVGIACKPFLLPFVGYAVMRHRWRMLIGILYGVVATVVVGIAVFGWANTVLWVSTLKAVESNTSLIAVVVNGSIMGFLSRFLEDWSVVRLAWLAGSAVVGCVLLWRWSQADDNAAWMATLVGGLLASPLGWAYYAPLMLAPFASTTSPLLWVGYALLCLPVQPLAEVSHSLAWTLTVSSAPFWAFVALMIGSRISRDDGRSAYSAPAVASGHPLPAVRRRHHPVARTSDGNARSALPALPRHQ